MSHIFAQIRVPSRIRNQVPTMMLPYGSLHSLSMLCYNPYNAAACHYNISTTRRTFTHCIGMHPLQGDGPFKWRTIASRTQ
jgi:hypothetical protein